MTPFDWLYLALLLLFLLFFVPLLGSYMAKLFSGEPTPLHSVIGPLEKISYKVARIDPEREMNGKQYAFNMLLLNLFGFLLLFLLQEAQSFLPLNPEEMATPTWPLAFNTAISFTTNTNWQAYAGETTMSYLTQMMGLTVQNFLSAATGISVLVALARSFVRKSIQTIGNFWVDLVRTLLYLLLPLALLFSLFLASEGVIQTLLPSVTVTTIEGGTQTLPLGPVASQEAIKLLGTNGGGFFQANSAHPFENPKGITNFFEILALLLLPAALTFTFGRMVGSQKHGWLLFLAMLVLWLGGLFLAFRFENAGNPLLSATPLMEGKEMRFGLFPTIAWSISTTASANGAVNGALTSLTPVAGGVSLFNIMLGELIFGGVGVGLSTMILFVILTLFLCGLMVGRTPEYLGKKIEKKEMQWVLLGILAPCALILMGGALSSYLPIATSYLSSIGPHALSDLLYAFSSSTGNNGSSFSSLNVNNSFFNITLGFVMMMGRLAILLPTVALAGLFAEKKITPPSAGTFSTETLLFLILLISTILIVGALTFFPALSLGPILEHFLMMRGEAF